MATSLKTAIAGEQLNVKVKIKNKGGEAAYNIKVAIEIRGIEKVRHLKDKLSAGKTCEAAFSFYLNGKKGWHPILINTTYSDYNQNPYQIITVTEYALQGRPSEISAHYIKPGEMVATGHIRLKNNETKNLAVCIKNNSQADVQNIPSPRKQGTRRKEKLVTLKLIYPENVDIEPNHFQIALGWKEEQIVPFRIKNRSFNPGSSIPVYAIAEYDEKGIHYLTITSILLSIEKGENLFAGWNKALITVGVLLTLICLSINMRRFRKPGVNPDTEIHNSQFTIQNPHSRHPCQHCDHPVSLHLLQTGIPFFPDYDNGWRYRISLLYGEISQRCPPAAGKDRRLDDGQLCGLSCFSILFPLSLSPDGRSFIFYSSSNFL